MGNDAAYLCWQNDVKVRASAMSGSWNAKGSRQAGDTDPRPMNARVIDSMHKDPRLTHALDLSNRGQHSAAARILRRLALAGDADAAAHLGILIDLGVQTADPTETAAGWYKVAAEGGSALGAFEHSLDLAVEGEPISGEASDWYERGLSGLIRLAEDGDAACQFRLWSVYENGLGIEKDGDRALGYLRAAAKNRHLRALFSLGYWHWEQPHRTEDQRRQAIRLWRRAANAGLRSAQYHLGAYYATEPDMPINFRESIRFYRMAALNGDTEALYNLGTMYLDGEGVARDEVAGHAMIVEAGKRGCLNAYFYLCRAYEFGYHGVPVDPEEAESWKAQRRLSDEPD